MRQDPDIIMVGEIRDEETADIAINSAMTGHLVLSTFHTNDAPTALPRFLDMGVKNFLVTSTVNLIIAQRLVRKVCEKCKKEEKIDARVRELMTTQFSEHIMTKYKLTNVKSLLIKGQGCAICKSGYVGRLGIYEMLEMSEDIKEMIMQNMNATQIKNELWSLV